MGALRKQETYFAQIQIYPMSKFTCTSSTAN